MRSAARCACSRAGEADAVLAGGSEAGLAPLARAAFSALDALSECGISRPFDARRDGFVMGEGAAVLVLERGGPAEARGARVLGTIRGYGSSSDAYHLTAPREDGEGQADAMTAALADAGVAAEEVDYVNAHGTSTPLNDRAETHAIKLALGERAKSDPGLLDEVRDRASARRRRRGRGGGHAAGPARSHRPADAGMVSEREEELDLDYVPGAARPLQVPEGRPALALSNSFGFGGHNAVLCLEAA